MSDKNLTGEQIQHILDQFLYKALEPIIKLSGAFDVQMVYLLGLITKNRKRKLSSIPREDAINFLSRALVTSDPSEKLKLFRQAKVERHFIHVFVRRYVEMCAQYKKEYSKYLCSDKVMRKLHKKRLDLMANDLRTDRTSLFIIANNSPASLELFYKYREEILSHYVQMASSQSKTFVKSNPYSGYDFRDFRQSLLRSILLAIDKYDSSKGALTSYINWWVLNAQTCGGSDYEYGIAYTVPQAHKRKIANKTSSDVNFSLSLDTLTKNSDEEEDAGLHSILGNGPDMLDVMSSDQNVSRIQYLVKCVDVNGVVRLSMDIGEYFSKREKRRMKKQMKRQKLI